MPQEWHVRTEVQNALVDLIVARAVFVADTIVELLWPQRELDFDVGSEMEKPS
jgi:hypothetical protein